MVEKAFSDAIPLNAQFELTYRCNHLCTFCYNAPDGNREMTTPEIFDSLRKIAEFGVLYVTLTGGEPLCHRDFFKIADETVAEDSEKLMAFLAEKGHPALTMESMF